jgi:hypothetical protein
METQRPTQRQRPKTMLEMMQEVLVSTNEIKELKAELSILSNEIVGLKSKISDMQPLDNQEVQSESK